MPLFFGTSRNINRYKYMIRLQPIQTEQTIRILPRSLSAFDEKIAFELRVSKDNGTLIENTCFDKFIVDEISIKIVNEDSKQEEVLTDLHVVLSNGFVEITLASTILEEDALYSLEMSYSGNLWYRDNIYSTSSTSTEKYHNITKDTYVAPSVNEDKEYIQL